MLTSLVTVEKPARTVVTVATSIIPVAIIGGLLYAAFFVKAAALVSSVQPPAIERRDHFLGVALPGDKTIWAVGSNGKIVRSDNLGANWAAQFSPAVDNLQGIAAWDEQRAVAVGGGGVVVNTEDGGQHWQEVAVPKSEVANKLLNVRSFAGGVGWAVGELGAVLKTADYGKSWERAIPEKDQAWNDIAFSGGQGVLVGEFGQIMHSADAGKTWRAASSGSKSSLMSVAFRDASTAVAVGLSGVVLVSHDGGEKWSIAPQQTREHLNNVIWDGERWLAVGDKGLLLSGDKSGSNWQAGRVSEGNLGWNTQIVRQGSATPAAYVLAGAGLSQLADGKLTAFGQ